jgi:hypothetical protein
LIGPFFIRGPSLNWDFYVISDSGGSNHTICESDRELEEKAALPIIDKHQPLQNKLEASVSKSLKGDELMCESMLTTKS